MNYISSSDFFFLTPLKQPHGWKSYLKVACIDLLLGWLFVIAEIMGIFLRLVLGLLFALPYVVTGAVYLCTCGNYPQLDHTDDDCVASHLGALVGSYVAAGKSTEEDQRTIDAWRNTFQSLFLFFLDSTTLTIKVVKPGHQSR